MQHISLLVRIKALCTRNKEAFWWNYFTDEEKQLRRMDVWQLAKVINEARIRNIAGEAEKLIVAEHILSERIARIQSRPAWVAIWAGLIGVVGGAFLTSTLQQSDSQPKCVCECQHSASVQQSMTNPAR